VPITCITGTPGAGKTLSALEELFKEVGISVRGKTVEQLREELQQKQDRPVYVCNVRGLKPGLFEEIADPFGWEDLPDGSLILVDEAWEFFGKHLRNSDDPRVLNFAKHRHRGFDWIMTTQAPSQLAPFLRDLLGRHIHVTRKFGTQTTYRYEWPHVQDNPNSQTAKGHAIEQMWRYPHEVFALYESATLHTVKRRIPRKIIVALVVAAFSFVAIPGAFYFLWEALGGSEAQATVAAQAATGEARSVASTDPSGDGEDILTPEQYAYMRSPRIAADPASAPLYDRFEVQDYPRMFCMISGDQRIERISCRCRTQQMTPILVEDRICIHVARNGMWDPRLKPVGQTAGDGAPKFEEPNRLGEIGHDAGTGPAGAGIGIDRSIRTPYVIPDKQPDAVLDTGNIN